MWNPEEPLTLYLSGTATDIVRMELQAAAAVVDSSGVLYTPLSYANVPPPMALHTLDNGWVRQAVFVAEFDGTGEAAMQAWPVAAEIVLLTAAPHTGQVQAAAADGGAYEITAARPSDDSNRAVVVVGHSARS
ncbi:hypothetical protein IWQ57_003644 [Coemansia nantahalensis]|uniref:Uncharacterized protein n=2 Tax=Coemansia TaxID=4863 RepID=A0ACC1LAM8_9FUNG|nr:hypothetical protein IWQ57_003644 [Coemansia nantahalensis]KAJ2804784.1 hypothetical protein H4R21_001508 [Coemansia helicoidea]